MGIPDHGARVRCVISFSSSGRFTCGETTPFGQKFGCSPKSIWT